MPCRRHIDILRDFHSEPGRASGSKPSGDKRLADIFHEVDEEIRRERLKRIWDRYGALILAAVLLVVAGIGGWRGYEYLQNQRAAESGAQFEAAMALAEGGKLEEAEKAFAKIATDGTTGYGLLARLREAEAMAPRDRAAAVAVFDKVAADTSASARFQDLAAVRAGFLLVDSATFSDMEKRLQTATGAQRPFRHSARELLVLSAFKAGDAQGVRRWADMITNDAESPASMRARIEAMLALSNVAKG